MKNIYEEMKKRRKPWYRCRRIFRLIRERNILWRHLYYLEHKEEYIARVYAWRKFNKHHHEQYLRKYLKVYLPIWIKENPDKIKEYRAKQYQSNKEACNKQSKEWREAHKAETKAYHKEYQKVYNKTDEYRAKRRAYEQTEERKEYRKKYYEAKKLYNM